MFNNNGSSYSLSDIAAVTGRNNGSGFGDGDSVWWILLFLIFGWGNNGYWGGNGGGNTVREEIAYGFDMNGLENSVRGIQQGLCDGFYAVNNSMLTGFGDVQSALCQGFSGVNNAITTSGYDTLQAIHANTVANMQNTTGINAGITALGTQLASCCCDLGRSIERGFSDVNYNMATQACDTRRAIADSTRDIIESNNAGVRSILDFLTQDKIASLQAENQSLKFQASQADQNAVLKAAMDANAAQIIRRTGNDCPIPAYVVPNPNCCYTPFNYGGGCCNTGCF